MEGGGGWILLLSVFVIWAAVAASLSGGGPRMSGPEYTVGVSLTVGITNPIAALVVPDAEGACATDVTAEVADKPEEDDDEVELSATLLSHLLWRLA